MFRLILAILIFAVLAIDAQAGGRCRRTYQTISSSYGWSHSAGCYSCHAKKSYSGDWRSALSEIARRRDDNLSFERSLAQVLGTPSATTGYSTSYSGQYSSYPVSGSTLFGVSAYQSNPLLDLGAVINGQQKLAQQLAAGAQSSAADTADIASLTYQLENDRQAKIAAYSAIAAVSQGAPPQPTASTFRFQATVQPNGQVAIQQEPTVMALGATDLDAILQNRCAECHAGDAHKFRLAEYDVAMFGEVVRRINLPADDPEAMPKVKDGEGFKPGVPLPLEERLAIQEAYIRGKN